MIFLVDQIMDKSWIHNDNSVSNKYLQGVANFIKFTFQGVARDENILYPCLKCYNSYRETIKNT